MSEHVIGRDAELAALESFLDSVSQGPTAVELEGDAGAGKTTLWRAAVDRARARGMKVLEAQPAVSEAELTFSGVADLLGPELEDVLDELPPPQRRALGFALLLEDAEGPPPDQRAVAAAVLGALQALSRSEPVVVAVDDLQWLDAASSAALLYAARRLRDEPVGLLLVHRPGEPRELLTELCRSIPRARYRRVDIGALDFTALHGVVSRELGVSMPRPLLARIHEVSRGNPFYALELARAIAGVPLIEAAAPLPVPETLRELVRDRVEALPAECRRALLVAAALASPTVTLIERATGLGGDELQPAIEAQIVELDRGRVRFTHPLLAAASYEEAAADARRAVHRRLAEVVEDPEERARHLGLSTEAPHEGVAAAIESAALRARSRGSSAAAADLLERAAQLTPESSAAQRWRRMSEAGAYRFESGDGRRARVLLDDVIRSAPQGPERALALARLARVRSLDDDVREALALSEQALAEAEGSPLVHAEAHECAAACLVRLRERLDELLAHAAAAVDARRVLDDDVAEALNVRLMAEGLSGGEQARDTLDAALRLQDRSEHAPLLRQPLTHAAVCWLWWDEPARARTTFESLLTRAREVGDESSVPYLLTFLASADWLLGEYAPSLRRIADGLDVVEQAGQEAMKAYLLAIRALVRACTGPLDGARDDAAEALELAARTSIRPADYLARWALGLASLAGDDAEAARRVLLPAVEHARAAGIAEPGAIRFVTDAVEALTLVGRVDEAEEILTWYEGNAARLGRNSALALCSRCRALLAAERGDVAGARAELERALERHARAPFPFERARTLALLGALERRSKRRRAARATLESALGELQRTGAEPWADRVSDELRRISGRAPTLGALTPAEQRVAGLVAEGKTNREVAAALFLSERTVEGHLSHVFVKLGVRSRTELARALAGGHSQGVAGSNTGGSPVSGASSTP